MGGSTCTSNESRWEIMISPYFIELEVSSYMTENVQISTTVIRIFLISHSTMLHLKHLTSVSVVPPMTVTPANKKEKSPQKYRVAQNHGKQVLRISHINFHFTIIQFVDIPHGQ